jgi:hypothetical protein
MEQYTVSPFLRFRNASKLMGAYFICYSSSEVFPGFDVIGGVGCGQLGGVLVAAGSTRKHIYHNAEALAHEVKRAVVFAVFRGGDDDAIEFLEGIGEAYFDYAGDGFEVS